MVEWVLFVILMVSPTNVEVKHHGTYPTMEECFEAHELVVERFGRPIINYRPVCMQKAVEI